MIVYNYDYKGRFLGYEEADESPLEPGVYLIPGQATNIEPPIFEKGFMAVFSGDAWKIEDISLESTEMPKEKMNEDKTVAEILIAELGIYKEKQRILQETLDTFILSSKADYLDNTVKQSS